MSTDPIHTAGLELRPIAPANIIAESDASISQRQEPPGREQVDAHITPVPSRVDTLATPTTPLLKPARANLIILMLSTITFMTSLTSGLIVVGLPRIAKDLAIPDQLYLWPTSVFGLTAGSALLVSGAVADVVGPRFVDLVGCILLGVFTLAVGFSRTGIQLIAFRALQGVSVAMHMPCSVALITRYVPSGPRRNIGFACLGLSMPLGFSIGLVLGGILVDTVGWKFGFYLAGGIMLVLAGCGFRILPADPKIENVKHKLRKDIDWIGASIACAGLSLFSYVLAVLSANGSQSLKSDTIGMLVTSILLMLFFPVWMHRQGKKGQPALIPNALWKKLPFTSICILTVITWGVGNSMELFSSLYFQEVQHSTALQASLGLLPSLLVGVILNFTTGHLVDRVSGFSLLMLSMSLTSAAPLLMALINPGWSYWRGAFFAQLLSPLGGDVLFTVGLIVVSNVFPENTQALAGAVFNTVAYFGMSLGINLMQIASLVVTEEAASHYRKDKSSPVALLKGYRAAFWTMFGSTLACAAICALGLRGVGKVGLKRE